MQIVWAGIYFPLDSKSGRHQTKNQASSREDAGLCQLCFLLLLYAIIFGGQTAAFCRDSQMVLHI